VLRCSGSKRGGRPVSIPWRVISLCREGSWFRRRLRRCNRCQSPFSTVQNQPSTTTCKRVVNTVSIPSSVHVRLLGQWIAWIAFPQFIAFDHPSPNSKARPSSNRTLWCGHCRQWSTPGRRGLSKGWFRERSGCGGVVCGGGLWWKWRRWSSFWWETREFTMLFCWAAPFGWDCRCRSRRWLGRFARIANGQVRIALIK